MKSSAEHHPGDRPRTSRDRPRPWQRFSDRYPAVVDAYDALREACNGAGPLSDRDVALIKLAVSVGAGADRTMHMHTKKALAAGASPEALRQVALVAMPTIGLPAALDALRCVDESILEACAPAAVAGSSHVAGSSRVAGPLHVGADIQAGPRRSSGRT